MGDQCAKADNTLLHNVNIILKKVMWKHFVRITICIITDINAQGSLKVCVAWFPIP